MPCFLTLQIFWNNKTINKPTSIFTNNFTKLIGQKNIIFFFGFWYFFICSFNFNTVFSISFLVLTLYFLIYFNIDCLIDFLVALYHIRLRCVFLLMIQSVTILGMNSMALQIDKIQQIYNFLMNLFFLTSQHVDLSTC